MRPTTTLDWLHPELDLCRRLIADQTGSRRWTKVSNRGVTELVTEADLAVEGVLVEAINRRMPGAAIVSEESAPDEAALDRPGDCFVIDPIDGTEELANGRPGYAISVAMFHDGMPAAAVLDLPALDQRFTCAVGGGAFLNGSPVALSKVRRLDEAVLAVSASQRGFPDLADFWESIGARSLVPTPGFAAKCASVLAGVCDAVLYLPVRPYPTAIWDYAAAATLIAEAGGWYGSIDGEELLVQRPFIHRGGWIVASPKLRDELLDVAQAARHMGG
jgi:myo-inositol-1(or 4)-monophosphatase